MKRICNVLLLFLFFCVSNTTTAQTKITNKTILCSRGGINEIHDNDQNLVATLENICKKIFNGHTSAGEDKTHVFFINFETKNFFRFDRDTKNIYQLNWYSDFPFDKERIVESINDPEIIINLKNPSKKSIEHCKYKYSYYIDFFLDFACIKRMCADNTYFSEIDLSADCNTLFTANTIYIGLKIYLNQQYLNKLIIFKNE